MKYISIFHANLNYAFLEPYKYEQVIRASYETIFDTHARLGPAAKFVFEASGFTIDVMAEKTPDVLAKLRRLIESGQCEFMGAPYSHPIMANIPEEDGYWSCEFAQRAYERHLGFRAESFWNPECTWMQYVPRAYQRAGAKYLTLDFESYMTCNNRDYGWVERNRARDMNWGGNLPWYSLDPNCKFLHRPFRNVVPGLHGFCRSDRLVGKYVGYFLGRLSLQDYLTNVKRWSGSGKGATIIIADDAEYCGTTGYFFVKYFRDYSRSFEVDPGAGKKLEALIRGVMDMGEMSGFIEACEAVEPVEEPFFVEDRFAWHRTFADAWAGTPEARAWDPVLETLRRDYKTNLQPLTEGSHKDIYRPLVEKFWYHLTNSANSDGRWPPPPARTCEFNRDWVLVEIEATKSVLAELNAMVAARGDCLPETAGCASDFIQEPGIYGHYFTDKDTDNLEALNLYELGHALYAAFKALDGASDELAKSRALDKIRRCYDAYQKQGFENMEPPTILADGGETKKR